MRHQLQAVQEELDAAEARLQDERSAHERRRETVYSLQQQLAALHLQLDNTQSEAQAKLEATSLNKQVEIDSLKKVCRCNL